LNRGLDINNFGKRISFFFNAHNHFFEEIAKFRAARKMWANIMKSMGATDERAMMLRFHTQTGGSTLTAQQPYNNIARVTIQTMAAVLGGTQSLHTNSYDEALGLPTQAAAEIALRTQQIVAFESGITETVDPLAGSYFIEELTNTLEQKAQNYINTIDEMGGSIVAIENKYMEQEIMDSAYKYQRKIETKEKIIVGLNEFITKDSTQIPVLRIYDNIRITQIEKLNLLKMKRNAQEVTLALKNIQKAAIENTNLMPAVLNAVEQYCTLGEIAQCLREIFGEYKS
ncbi:MAG: methylmalonyl-CoA mutase family protein, partial [Sediminibacterium sp.]|nr:methylmalonyl-CoA mutase family protein [Sediminibacterium sp.]